MILWGLAGSAMIFVSSPAIFYILRFFLGAFEAGFVPGVIYYLTRWYPGARRGNILALFLLGMPISGVLGGPLAGWVLSSLHNSLGLQGWQWLFLIEGIPAVILGCMVYFLLDDEPAKAKWLSSRERAIVIRNVHAEQVNNGAGHGHSLGQALKDPRIYVMCLAYFTFISGIYAIGFWLPAMLKNAGIKDVFSIGLYSMIPFGVSALGMVIICRSSDRRLERRWHLALSAMVGAVTLAIIPATQASLGLSLVVMAVSTTAIYATLPMFWSIPSAYFAGTPAAAGSIAFINSLGLLGGLVSPVVIGWIKTTTGSMSNGLYAMSAMLIAGAVLMLLGIPAKAIRERAES
jgi:sugar phosphate permease